MSHPLNIEKLHENHPFCLFYTISSLMTDSFVMEKQNKTRNLFKSLHTCCSWTQKLFKVRTSDQIVKRFYVTLSFLTLRLLILL